MRKLAGCLKDVTQLMSGCSNSLLLDHMKKFPVSSAGGIKLAKYVNYLSLLRKTNCLSSDLKGYLDAISTFSMPALLERYEFLCQLGNIFVVPPEIVSSYIAEDLGRIDRALLRPYLMQRSDWNQLSLAGLDLEPGSTVENESSRRLRERLGAGAIGAMNSLKTGYDEMKPFSLPTLGIATYSL